MNNERYIEESEVLKQEIYHEILAYFVVSVFYVVAAGLTGYLATEYSLLWLIITAFSLYRAGNSYSKLGRYYIYYQQLNVILNLGCKINALGVSGVDIKLNSLSHQAVARMNNGLHYSDSLDRLHRDMIELYDDIRTTTLHTE